MGILPEKGCSWVWKKEEVLQAIKNYENFLEKHKKQIENIKKATEMIKNLVGEKEANLFEEILTNSLIEEFWIKHNRNIKFVKKGENTFYYWIEPLQKVSITDWTTTEGYSRKWKFPHRKLRNPSQACHRIHI